MRDETTEVQDSYLQKFVSAMATADWDEATVLMCLNNIYDDGFEDGKNEGCGRLHKPLYSLYCHQLNQTMATGRNCITKEEVKSELLSYLSGDHNNEQIKNLSKLKPDTLAEMYEFEIYGHQEEDAEFGDD